MVIKALEEEVLRILESGELENDPRRIGEKERKAKSLSGNRPLESIPIRAEVCISYESTGRYLFAAGNYGRLCDQLRDIGLINLCPYLLKRAIKCYKKASEDRSLSKERKKIPIDIGHTYAKLSGALYSHNRIKEARKKLSISFRLLRKFGINPQGYKYINKIRKKFKHEKSN